MSPFRKVPLGAEEKRYIHLGLDAFNALNSAEWNTFNWPIRY